MHRTENQIERASDHLIEVLLSEQFGQASPPDFSERILAQIAIEHQAGPLSLRRVSPSRQGYWTWLLSVAAIGILCVIGFSINQRGPIPTQASTAPIAVPVPNPARLEGVVPNDVVANDAVAKLPIDKDSSDQPPVHARDPVKLELPLDKLPFGNRFQESSGENAIVKSESQKSHRDRPTQLSDQQIVAQIDEQLVALWRSSGFDAPSTKSSDTPWLERLRQVGAAPASSTVTPAEPLPSVRKQASALADQWLRLLLPDESLNKLSADRKAILTESLAKSFAGETPWDVQIEQLFGVELTTNVSLANDSAFLASLGSPHSTNVVDQAGRVLFNEDLACARCHDHPLQSHVSQIDYWSIAAIFQNDLRWYEQDGVVHVAGQSPESVPAALFYDTFDGRTRVASPRLPHVYGSTSDEANVQNLIVGAERSGALAQTTTNLLWRMVFKRPLVGAVADPESPPLEPQLESIHRLISEQLVAHNYDLGKALGWILQTRPMRSEYVQLAAQQLLTTAELELADRRARLFIDFPPHGTNPSVNTLLALVDQWNRPSAARRDGAVLAQVDGTNSAGNTRVSNPEENFLRSTFPVRRTSPPVTWLNSLDSFDEKSRHLFYLAGIHRPTSRQLEWSAKIHEATGGDEATSLHQLWWLLAHRSDG